MPKMTQEHQQARRNQILQAACNCFSRKGIQQTTIREICTEARLSAGAVYGYFKTKDEIVEAMTELGRESTGLFFKSIRTDEAAPSSLVQLFDAVIEFLDSGPGRESTRLNVRVWSEGLTTPRIRELLLLGVPNARTPFADRVRAGQERGELDPRLDPEEVADVFVALYMGLSLQTALGLEVDAKGFSAVVSSFLTGTFAMGKNGE